MAVRHTNPLTFSLPAPPERISKNSEKEQAHIDCALALALQIDNWQYVLAQLRQYARSNNKTMADAAKAIIWHQVAHVADKIYLVSPITLMVPSQALSRKYFPLYFVAGATSDATKANYQKSIDRWAVKTPEKPAVAIPSAAQRFMNVINKIDGREARAGIPDLPDPLSLLINAGKSIKNKDLKKGGIDDGDYEFNEI